MKLNIFTIVLVTIFCSCCVFANSKYTLDQLTGTWVVRNTSAESEIGKCPFVLINKTRNHTANVRYLSDNKNFIVNLNTTNLNNKLYNEFGLWVGNLTIYEAYLPFYMVIRINNTEEGFSPYMVLTGCYQLPEKMDRNIMQFWKTFNATRNVSLFSTSHEEKRCNQLLSVNSYPAVNKTYPNVIPTSINNDSVNNGTTQKPKTPKNATNRVTSDILLTMILVCVTSYSRAN